MGILESGENYLETILILQNRHGFVRSVDIASHLGYSKPSVSRAVSILKKNGYISVAANGNIELTDKGIKKAEQIFERHEVITEFLSSILDVESDTAETDACRIEHVVSSDVIAAMKKMIEEYRKD